MFPGVFPSCLYPGMDVLVFGSVQFTDIDQGRIFGFSAHVPKNQFSFLLQFSLWVPFYKKDTISKGSKNPTNEMYKRNFLLVDHVCMKRIAICYVSQNMINVFALENSMHKVLHPCMYILITWPYLLKRIWLQFRSSYNENY